MKLALKFSKDGDSLRLFLVCLLTDIVVIGLLNILRLVLLIHTTVILTTTNLT